ncbi:MAG: dihydroneopterin aldolase [Phycisphaerae bacterium]
MKRMTIRIKNLRLRAIVGIFDWERTNPQDVLVNIAMDFDATAAARSDDIDDTVDYKAVKKKIIQHVESSNYQLVEKLASTVLDLVMEDQKVLSATVEIDKPHALRFADSVSVSLTATR